MKTQRTTRIIYWVFTGIVFLFDSVMPALTGNTELAKQGIAHLGYPDYFRVELNIFKVLGGIVLILPMIPRRYKEWAYAGFAISFISAFIGHVVVDGFTGMAILPLSILVMLIISYITYDKLQSAKPAGSRPEGYSVV